MEKSTPPHRSDLLDFARLRRKEQIGVQESML